MRTQGSRPPGYSTRVNIQRRVIGQSIVLGRNGQASGIDVDALIHRLLLFDGYVLRTVRFKEVPFLIKAFGYDQTIELLNSGLIEIRCEVHQIASQRDAELKRRPKPEFCLVWVEAHNWDEYVATCLREVQSELGLPLSQWTQLERAIRNRIRQLRWDIKQEIASSYVSSVANSPEVLAECIRLAGRRRRLPIVFPEIEIHAERLDDDLTRVESNLRHLRIPKDELWEVVRDGLMGIGSLEQAIGEMKNYEAIGGFGAEELPVFERKLSLVARVAYSEATERRAFRVARLTGMPLFDSAARIDMEKLLKARDSDELRAFRDWLASSDGVSDDRVRELLKGYRARLSTRLRSGSSTMARLMVEVTVGIVNPAAGIALSLLDVFLLEKLLPYCGPAAFVNKTFPSLFVKKN